MLPTIDIMVPAGGQQASANVPAFLAKLWKMVDDPSTDDMIAWSAEGTSFVIHNQAAFAQTLLPFYYKHSNLSSFVRQLNMYDFHKVVGVDSGGLKSERQEEMEFQHQYFIKGCENLLENIKRKVSANKAAQFLPSIKTEKVNEVLSEVSNLKDKQDDMDNKLDSMKKENEALWREVVNLRQKHQNQQKIVNKLIHFLVSMVQPRMAPAVKRRYQGHLAIEGASLSKEMRLDGNATATPSASGAGGSGLSGGSGGIDLGPIIRDITHESQPAAATATAHTIESLLTEQQPPDVQGESVISIELPVTPEAAETQAQPKFANIMRAVDPSLVNPSFKAATPSPSKPTASSSTTMPATKRIAVTKMSPTRPQLKRLESREDMDQEMTFMQKDLDNLRDILSGQVTVDSNFISSLFNPDDPLPNIMLQNPGVGLPAALNAADVPGAGAGSASPLSLQMDGGANGGAGAAPSLLDMADLDDDGNLGAPTTNEDGGIGDVTLNTPLVFPDENPMISQAKK